MIALPATESRSIFSLAESALGQFAPARRCQNGLTITYLIILYKFINQKGYDSLFGWQGARRDNTKIR